MPRRIVWFAACFLAKNRPPIPDKRLPRNPACRECAASGGTACRHQPLGVCDFLLGGPPKTLTNRRSYNLSTRGIERASPPTVRSFHNSDSANIANSLERQRQAVPCRSRHAHTWTKKLFRLPRRTGEPRQNHSSSTCCERPSGATGHCGGDAWGRSKVPVQSGYR